MIAIGLNKQEALDADSKGIQQINFTVNVAREAGATTFFIIEETKKTCFRFLTRNCKMILILLFALI